MEILTLYVEIRLALYVKHIREIIDSLRRNETCTLRETLYVKILTLYVEIRLAPYVNTLRERCT